MEGFQPTRGGFNPQVSAGPIKPNTVPIQPDALSGRRFYWCTHEGIRSVLIFNLRGKREFILVFVKMQLQDISVFEWQAVFAPV